MRKTFVLVLLALVFSGLTAQERFELELNTNSGLYFSESAVSGYNINNGVQFGIGSQLNYIINTRTKTGIGLNFNYVKTSENVYYNPTPLIPDLSTIEMPITIIRTINLWFFTAGAAGYWHIGNNKPLNGVIGKWEVGAGCHFQKLDISVNYSQNFKNHQVQIYYDNSSNVGFSEYERKIVSLNLEFHLWKF